MTMSVVGTIVFFYNRPQGVDRSLPDIATDLLGDFRLLGTNVVVSTCIRSLKRVYDRAEVFSLADWLLLVCSTHSSEVNVRCSFSF